MAADETSGTTLGIVRDRPAEDLRASNQKAHNELEEVHHVTWASRIAGRGVSRQPVQR